MNPGRIRLASASTTWSPDTHPGWSNIVGLAGYVIGHALPEGEQQALRPPTIADGRLRIDITDPSPRALGYAAATEAMSAETCEQCGSKGDPISEAARGCTGCRCLKCRGAGRVLPRPYSGEDVRAAALMRADDDNGRMWGFTNSPGWAGLVRALLLTLESTHEQFRQDPDKPAWKRPYIKEKWGNLRCDTSGATPYQRAVEDYIENLSGWVCHNCGKPAETRYALWVRTECDYCWSKASPEDQQRHLQRIAEGKEDEARAGYRSVTIAPGMRSAPFRTTFG